MARHMAPARAAAKKAGATFYKGPPCKHGHDGERYTSTNACRKCISTQARPDRVKAPAPIADDFDSLQ